MTQRGIPSTLPYNPSGDTAILREEARLYDEPRQDIDPRLHDIAVVGGMALDVSVTRRGMDKIALLGEKRREKLDLADGKDAEVGVRRE